MNSTKFKIGDLIIYPAERAGDPFDDYGVVVDIIDTTTLGSLEQEYAYVIMWAVEGQSTTEEWWWVEENLLLVSRA